MVTRGKGKGQKYSIYSGSRGYVCEPHTKHYVIAHRRTVVGRGRAARFDSVESTSILDYKQLTASCWDVSPL